MLDGSDPLWGHHCVLKSGVCVTMFVRRRHQSPIAWATRPPELQTQIYDHVTLTVYPNVGAPAGSTGTCRKASLTPTRHWRIRAVLPCRCRKNNTRNNTHYAARDQARMVARKINRYRHQRWSGRPRVQTRNSVLCEVWVRELRPEAKPYVRKCRPRNASQNPEHARV